MSNDPASRHHGARDSSNKTGILLAGGAALALLLGGGYYAWTQADSNQVASNSADDAAYVAGPSENFAPIGNDAVVEQDFAAAADNQARVGAPTEAVAAPPAKPTKARIAAAQTPVETIGVSRENQSDEVIVNAPRRAVWSRKPSAERLSEYYPAFALERGREGEASLNCTVAERGALKCVRVSETPARAGFGNAALQVARTLRHAPQRADGSNAIGTPVNLRVLFRLPDEDRRG